MPSISDEPFVDKVEIQETISLYHEGGSTTDWDQVMATFLPDGIWEVPAMGIRCQGHDDIRETMTTLLEPIEYLVQINAPAIIAVDGDSASARSLIRECAKFRGQPGLIDVVGQFNDELHGPPRVEVRPSHLHDPRHADVGRTMTEIAGKAAVVTGGGSGIGMGLAKELARQGASVAIADILPDTARRVADEINDAGGTAVAIECDVCDRSSIEQMKAEANAALGTVELVFANAGATSFVPVSELTDSELDWMTEVNMKGVVWTALTFLPDMVEAGGGHIVATASMAGLVPTLVPVHSAYAAAKMGVIGFVRSMQLEVEEHGVRCTIYCPGGVLNGMRDNNAKYRPERFGGPSDERMQIPKASFKDNRLRFYTPEDVAPIVLRAVRNDRPFVFDHSEQRQSFRELYADVVEACFDDIEQWEQENGLSPSASKEGELTCPIRPSPSCAPRGSSTWTSARWSRVRASSSRGTSSRR